MKAKSLFFNIKNYYVGALSSYDAPAGGDDAALRKEVRRLTKAIDGGKADFIAYCDRGVAHLDLGEPEQALQDFNRAIKLNPNDAVLYCNRGDAYAELGKYQLAMGDYDRALKMNPDMGTAWNNRGQANAETGELEAAVEDFGRAIELDRKNAAAWFNRGWTYFDLDKIDKAKKDFEVALKLEPGSPEILGSLAQAWRELGRPDKAIAQYTKLIEADPKNGYAYNNRGLVYQEEGDPERAAADFARALKLCPDESSVYNNIGLLYTATEEHRKEAPAFFTAALPLKILPPFFNRYGGDSNHYGFHTDNAMRGMPDGSGYVRADVSATLFFSEPEDYDGGLLTVDDTFGRHGVKLKAGSLVVYPSSSIHEVSPVTRGERVACFMFMQSMVRDAGQRRMLYDLDMALLDLREEIGETEPVVRMTGIYHNLLRRWADS